MKKYTKKFIRQAYMASFRNDWNEGDLGPGDVTRNGMPSRQYRAAFEKLIANEPEILEWFAPFLFLKGRDPRQDRKRK